ncbi:MAG: hypothetical protein ACR2O4_01920, partial [Hyphomicrobiaceae bacterium]
MADDGRNNETSQLGRFGFGSSSLRDALRSVAGLREPPTRPENRRVQNDAQPPEAGTRAPATQIPDRTAPTPRTMPQTSHPAHTVSQPVQTAARASVT